MPINGTIGNIAFYNGEKIVIGKSAVYFSINSQDLNKYYLFYFLKSNYAHTYYGNNFTGSTIKNLGLKALRNMCINLPNIKEQERMVGILNICKMKSSY